MARAIPLVQSTKGQASGEAKHHGQDDVDAPAEAGVAQDEGHDTRAETGEHRNLQVRVNRDKRSIARNALFSQQKNHRNVKYFSIIIYLTTG
jgi:hypothetical protein